MKKTQYLKKNFVKDPSIVARKIDNEYILVPIQPKAEDLESIYTLSEVGSFVWELVDGRKQVKEIKNLIVENFQVKPGQAEKDLVNFLKQLEKIGAVKEA